MQDDPKRRLEAPNSLGCQRSASGNPLIRKLESLAPLTPEDRQILEQITSRCRTVPPRTDLIRESDPPQGVFLVMDGFACRYKLRAAGGRQIIAYLLPGDFCDLDVALLNEMDHAIGTVTACRIVQIAPETIQDLLNNHPATARAMRLATLVDEATLREWLVNVGRRTAEERVAHLLCELLLRLQAVGRAGDFDYDFPITQGELADTTGLTSVHVNRTLKVLRERKLIQITRRRLRILDLERLQALAEFKPTYLHLLSRGGTTGNHLTA